MQIWLKLSKANQRPARLPEIVLTLTKRKENQKPFHKIYLRNIELLSWSICHNLYRFPALLLFTLFQICYEPLIKQFDRSTYNLAWQNSSSCGLGTYSVITFCYLTSETCVYYLLRNYIKARYQGNIILNNLISCRNYLPLK